MSDDISLGSPSSAGEHGVLRSMQEVAMSSQEASKMLRTYNIAWWGNNYYDVNELGHISVCPDPDVPEARVDLAELVKAREAQGRLARDVEPPQVVGSGLISALFLQARRTRPVAGQVNLALAVGTGEAWVGGAEQGNGRHVQCRRQVAKAGVDGHAGTGARQYTSHARQVELGQHFGVGQAQGQAFGPRLFGGVAPRQLYVHAQAAHAFGQPA